MPPKGNCVASVANRAIESTNQWHDCFIAGLTHDAVLLWAYGVNKTLEQGYSPSDGIRVTRNIVNSKSVGVTGNIVIDENGDRLRDYKVNFGSVKNS